MAQFFLEFAAVFFRPALDDNLLIRIELNRVAALAVEIAKKAVLPSTEREVRHRRGNTNVDADIARRRFVAEAARRRSTRGKQRRLVTIGAAFEEREGIVHIFRVNE